MSLCFGFFVIFFTLTSLRRALADLDHLTHTDNNILLQLGSVQEGSSQEEKESYINGLRQMISGMRDKNLRDVTTIASEIVAYRSRFLQDPSRVLTNLDPL
jgi:hypothetical protein